MSGGGVFESDRRGAAWRPLNAACRADFLPTPIPEFGHDPHCVRLHPVLPDRLYQQNHAASYRLDRPAERWQDIGASDAQERRRDRFPDGRASARSRHAVGVSHGRHQVWPRTSPAGRPAVYRSVNGGRSWQRQATGLPKVQAWLHRQAPGDDRRWTRPTASTSAPRR
jgi:hypothetical protein